MISEPTPPDAPGFELDSLVGAAGDRVQSVLSAAEDAAAGIIEEAEAEAKRFLETARERADRLTLERVRQISELSDEMLDQASTVKRHSDALIEVLDTALQRLGVEAAVEDVATGAAQAVDPAASEHPSTSEGRAEGSRERVEGALRELAGSEPEEAGPSSPTPPPSDADEQRTSQDESVSSDSESRVSESAFLLATQMAVAGSSREQIERRLQEEFGVDDPSTVLDAFPERPPTGAIPDA